MANESSGGSVLFQGDRCPVRRRFAPRHFKVSEEF
jgi:hypothetical protein